MKKRAILISLISIIVMGLILLAFNWHNKKYVSDNSNLISCDTHIDSNHDLICDKCNVILSYNEATLVKTVIEGKISDGTNIKLTGDMPLNSKLVLRDKDINEVKTIVEKYAADSQIIAAYDIEVMANNIKYEPLSNKESINVEISDLSLDSEKSYAMLHIMDNEKYEVIKVSKINDNTIRFNAKSFSTYILITVSGYNLTIVGSGDFKVKTDAGIEIENGASIVASEKINFTVEPDDDYVVTNVTLEENGVSKRIWKKLDGTINAYTINSINSNATVYITTELAPKITEQPITTKVKEGESAIFKIKADNTTLFEWQYRENDNDYWKAVDGEINTTNDASTLKIENVTANNTKYQYRCVLSNDKCKDDYSIKSDIVYAIYTNGTEKIMAMYSGDSLLEITGNVSIQGEVTLGGILTADTSEILPTDCTLTYKWYAIQNATSTIELLQEGASNQYTIGLGALEKYIYIEVEAKKTGYYPKVFTAMTYSTADKISVEIPRVSGEYVYNGQTQTAELLNFDSTKMTVTNNERMIAGTQYVLISLRDTENYKWKDADSEDIELPWTIEKADRIITVENINTVYNNEESQISYQYNGEEVGVNIKVSNEKANIVYTNQNNSGTITITPTEIGLINLIIYVADSTNYKDITLTKEIQIIEKIAEGELDITPPRGSITVVGATVENDVNKITGKEFVVQIYAEDNASPASEIKVYTVLDNVPDTEKILDSEWETYREGYTKILTIPDEQISTTVYVVLKDKAGNTNTIFNGENASYQLIYDANGGTNAPTNETVYFGMPFKVTKEQPTYEGKYFLGWSTTQNATLASYEQGGTIPASVFTGAQTNITLYAVWVDTIDKLQTLASKVKVGDYVNYPVSYENVLGQDLTGWRVLSVDHATDTVKLISSGTPLTYYHPSNTDTSVASIKAITEDFLQTEFSVVASTVEDYKFIKSGFDTRKMLEKVFLNKYTSTTDTVRTIKAEDIYDITGLSAMASGTTMDLSNSKYNNLFVNGSTYWIANANGSSLWNIQTDGSVSSNVTSELGIRPVVTLKSSVKTSGYDNTGRWNIEAEDLQEVTITFNANEGIVDKQGKNLIVGETYGNLPSPTREGYTFNGWYTAKTGGEKIESTTIVASSNVQTIYAHWVLYEVEEKSETSTYTVNHYLEALDGTGYEIIESEEKEGIVGTAVDVSSKKIDMEGAIYYRGAGTVEGVEGEIANPMVLANSALTVNLYYKRITYTITFDPTMGEGDITYITKKHGETVTLKEAPATSSDDTLYFRGWNTKEDGTGTTYAANAQYSEDGDIILYAHWVKDGVVIESETSTTM